MLRPSGGLGFFGLPLFTLCTAGQVLGDDVVDFLHDHGVKSRRFVDRRVRKTGLRGEIEIREFTLKAGSCGDPLTEAVLLKQVHQVQNILRHRLRAGRVEGDDQFDRNILPIELIGNVEGRIGSQGVTDKHDDRLVAAGILVGNALGRGRSAIRAVDARAISLAVQLFRERVHAAGENVGKPTK
jgi:hypothetical protein